MIQPHPKVIRAGKHRHQFSAVGEVKTKTRLNKHPANAELWIKTLVKFHKNNVSK